MTDTTDLERQIQRLERRVTALELGEKQSGLGMPKVEWGVLSTCPKCHCIGNGDCDVVGCPGRGK